MPVEATSMQPHAPLSAVYSMTSKQTCSMLVPLHSKSVALQSRDTQQKTNLGPFGITQQKQKEKLSRDKAKGSSNALPSGGEETPANDQVIR